MQKKVNKKVIAVCAAVFAVIVAVMCVIFFVTKPQTEKGDKTVEFSVISSDGEKVSDYRLETNGEYLREVLEENGLVDGEESQYGLFVKTVDGITADESKQEWWCFSGNGESLSAGIDSTPIYDGDKFEAVLMTGW